MDIATKLSEKYTLSDFFKQLFSQARIAAAAARGGRRGGAQDEVIEELKICNA
jgi:hypothetical protein